MSKRLPYFQFEPAEYLAGDIMFCSYAAQGIFNSICALYWQKDCVLNYSQLIKRLGNEELICELIHEKIIKVDNDVIIINFLNEQYTKATEKSKTNSTNGSKGAKARWQKDNEANSEIIATPLIRHSESIALREDKIKEDNININIYKELLISDSWIEINAKNNRTTPDKVKLYLTKFNNNLIAQGEKKNNKREYQSHFARWLPIEIAKEVKDKPKFTPLI